MQCSRRRNRMRCSRNRCSRNRCSRNRCSRSTCSRNMCSRNREAGIEEQLMLSCVRSQEAGSLKL